MLKDEIARLKGKPPKPKISPSTMDSTLSQSKSSRKKGKRKKNKKNKRVKVDKEIKLNPDNLPAGSQFKEYKDFLVQDIIFTTNNINFKRGKWITRT